MNSNQLLQFIAIAEEESVTKASKKLYMTQSALSNTLKQLEQELNCSLFDRYGNKLSLNINGRKLLEYAQKINSLLIEATQELQHSKFLPRINFLTNSSIYFSILADSYVNISTAYDIKMKNLPSNEILKSLDKNSIAILSDFPSPQNYNTDFEKFFLFKEQLMVSFPLNHILAFKDSISIRELEGENFAQIFDGNDYFWEEKLLREYNTNINFTTILSAQFSNQIPTKSLKEPLFTKSSVYLLSDKKINPLVRPVVPLNDANTTRSVFLWVDKKANKHVKEFINYIQPMLDSYPVKIN